MSYSNDQIWLKDIKLFYSALVLFELSAVILGWPADICWQGDGSILILNLVT